MNSKMLTVQIRNNTRKFKVDKKSLMSNLNCIVSMIEFDYELTLDVSFIGRGTIKSLNEKFRNINSSTNVLSFSDKIANNQLKRIGEVLICPAIAEEEAHRDKNDFNDYVGFLLIHGILHVIGYDHKTEAEQKEMEKLEETIFKGFKMKQFIKKGS